MNLRFVSITGADDRVDIKELENFSQQYPLFECAILMFPQSEGKPRNPVKAWRQEFYGSAVKNRALHLCGTSIDALAQEDETLMQEIVHFQRVQINLMPKWASPQLVESLVRVACKHPEIEFITQHNQANLDYFSYWDSVANHSYLFDASLGKGVAPAQWPQALAAKRCGYAGGINPENLLTNMALIKQAAQQQAVWIDLESGARTNNLFDLEKANYILEQAQLWYERNIGSL